MSTLFEFTVGATPYRYTNAQKDLTIDGDTYTSIYIERSEINLEELNSSVTVKMQPDQYPAKYFLDTGPPFSIQVKVYSLLSSNKIIVFDGYVTKGTFDNRKGIITLRATTNLKQDFPKRPLSTSCSWALYEGYDATFGTDVRCPVDRASHNTSITFDSNTSNFQLVTDTSDLEYKMKLQTQNSSHAVFGETSSDGKKDYLWGQVYFKNSGGTVLEKGFIIKITNVGLNYYLHLHARVVNTVYDGSSGDITQATVYKGCSKQYDTCKDKFSAEPNFGGLPFLANRGYTEQEDSGIRGQLPKTVPEVFGKVWVKGIPIWLGKPDFLTTSFRYIERFLKYSLTDPSKIINTFYFRGNDLEVAHFHIQSVIFMLAQKTDKMRGMKIRGVWTERGTDSNDHNTYIGDALPLTTGQNYYYDLYYLYARGDENTGSASPTYKIGHRTSNIAPSSSNATNKDFVTAVKNSEWPKDPAAAYKGGDILISPGLLLRDYRVSVKTTYYNGNQTTVDTYYNNYASSSNAPNLEFNSTSYVVFKESIFHTRGNDLSVLDRAFWGRNDKGANASTLDEGVDADYYPEPEFLVTRYPQISGVDHADDEVGNGANPANVIYYLITEIAGLSDSDIDLTSFTDARTKLEADGIGISKILDDPKELGSFIKKITDLIDGVFVRDLVTGKRKLLLMRSSNYGSQVHNSAIHSFNKNNSAKFRFDIKGIEELYSEIVVNYNFWKGSDDENYNKIENKMPMVNEVTEELLGYKKVKTISNDLISDDNGVAFYASKIFNKNTSSRISMSIEIPAKHLYDKSTNDSGNALNLGSIITYVDSNTVGTRNFRVVKISGINEFNSMVKLQCEDIITNYQYMPDAQVPLIPNTIYTVTNLDAIQFLSPPQGALSPATHIALTKKASGEIIDRIILRRFKNNTVTFNKTDPKGSVNIELTGYGELNAQFNPSSFIDRSSTGFSIANGVNIVEVDYHEDTWFSYPSLALIEGNNADDDWEFIAYRKLVDNDDGTWTLTDLIRNVYSPNIYDTDTSLSNYVAGKTNVTGQTTHPSSRKVWLFQGIGVVDTMIDDYSLTRTDFTTSPSSTKGYLDVEYYCENHRESSTRATTSQLFPLASSETTIPFIYKQEHPDPVASLFYYVESQAEIATTYYYYFIYFSQSNPVLYRSQGIDTMNPNKDVVITFSDEGDKIIVIQPQDEFQHPYMLVDSDDYIPKWTSVHGYIKHNNAFLYPMQSSSAEIEPKHDTGKTGKYLGMWDVNQKRFVDSLGLCMYKSTASTLEFTIYQEVNGVRSEAIDFTI